MQRSLLNAGGNEYRRKLTGNSLVAFRFGAVSELLHTFILANVFYKWRSVSFILGP